MPGTRSSGAAMPGISEQAPRSRDASPLGKLSRMLQSMLRKYPQARRFSTPGAFGVSLDENTYLRVSYSGHLTDADMRDLLALFATWLVADPSELRGRGIPLGGVLHTAVPASARSYGRSLDESDG